MDRSLSPVRQRPAWLVPLLCSITMILDGYEIYIYGATLPGIVGPHPWGVTVGSAATVGSVNIIGAFIGAIFSGTLADIFGRRKLFIVSLVLFSAAALGCAFAWNFVSFGVFRFVAGLGIGGISPAAVALAAEFARPRYRARVIATVLAWPAVGGIIASLVGILVLQKFGFGMAYALGAIPLVTILPAVIIWLPESVSFLRARGDHAAADATAARFGLGPATASAEAVDRRAGRNLGALFRGGNAFVTPALWLMMLMANLVVFGIGTWLPKFLVRGGFALNFALAANMILLSAIFVGTLIGATIADRLNAAKPLVLVGLIVSFTGYAIVFFFGSGVGVILGLGLAGLGSAASALLQVHIAEYYPPQYRATALGWAIGVGRLGAIAGPPYGAIFVALSQDVSIIAVAFGIPAFIGAVLVSFLPRRMRGQAVGQHRPGVLSPTAAAED